MEEITNSQFDQFEKKSDSADLQSVPTTYSKARPDRFQKPVRSAYIK
jgi:hypothetical protein